MPSDSADKTRREAASAKQSTRASLDAYERIYDEALRSIAERAYGGSLKSDSDVRDIHGTAYWSDVHAAARGRTESEICAAVDADDHAPNPYAYFASVRNAGWAGFVEGFKDGIKLDLDPWKETSVHLFRDSGYEDLTKDGIRVQRDFVSALEDLRDQLSRLPDETRDRLLAVIVDYLRAPSGAGGD